MIRPAWTRMENVTFEDKPWPTPREAKAQLWIDVNEILIQYGLNRSQLDGKHHNMKISEAKEKIAVIAHTRLIDWIPECEMGPCVGIARTCFVYALQRGKAKLKC